MKELVAKELAQRVANNTLIGVGTGSTVDLALIEIGKRIKNEGLKISIVPTSIQSATRCHQLGCTVLHPAAIGEIDWGFDGADQVDQDLRLIKGHGGALLREKILAVKCKIFTVIVDESKLTDTLGRNCLVPIEVIPEAHEYCTKEILKLGATSAEIRQCKGGKHGPVITECGNLIIDAGFTPIAPDLETRIKSITGVVENGIFSNHASEVLIASASGITRRSK